MGDTKTTAAEVAAAIDEDLADLRDPRVQAGIMAFRVVPPAPIQLAWNYGQPGETFGGWLVFSDPRQRTGIAYCDQGFGPKSPWGLIKGDSVAWRGRLLGPGAPSRGPGKSRRDQIQASKPPSTKPSTGSPHPPDSCRHHANT